MHVSRSHKEGMGANAPQPFDRPEPKARPKARLGEMSKSEDLPRSEEDANQPFYHEHAVLSQAAYDPIKFKSNYQDSCRFIQGLQ